MNTKNLKFPIDGFHLEGELTLPSRAKSLIIFSHGSGSCRTSVRNKKIAIYLQEAGFGTLLFDLLSGEEDEEEYRFDIELLAHRLTAITTWVSHQKRYQSLDFGFLGQSLGTAAALKTAAELGNPIIKAVVSQGGRPDLIKDDLPKISTPTLFIVGEFDPQTLKLNETALRYLNAPKQMAIIPAASHFFEEPGKLDLVARIAVTWFKKHLTVNNRSLISTNNKVYI